MSEYITPDSYQANYGLKENKREYTKKESLYAWFCVIAGYLFCRAFPAWSMPLGSFIVIMILFAGSFTMLRVSGFEIKAMPILSALSAVILSASMLFISNGFLQFFSYVYSVVIFFYFIYSATGNNLENGFSSLFFADFIKAVFVLPLNSLDALFYAALSPKSQKGTWLIAKIAFGVIAAVVPTAIVTVLLSYDSSFSKLIDSIISFDFYDVFSHAVSAFFGVLIGFYIFSLYISAVDKKSVDNMNADYWKKASDTLRFAPLVTVISATVPVLVVYVLFFFSQFEYFVSGFINSLPADFSYAEYAREGFFQLCAVSVINLIILSCVHLFTKRKTNKSPIIIKVISVIYSIFTLLLISTAMAKMVMYIGYYGLTPKRVYASWFMIVIAIVFVLVIIKQFCSSLKLLPISFASLVCLFTVLCFSNTDAIIAKYNVDQYLNGKLDTVDAELLHKLGDSGVEQLVRLYEYQNEQDEYLNSHIDLYMTRLENSLEDSSLFSYTIPKLKAKAAFEKYEIIEQEKIEFHSDMLLH